MTSIRIGRATRSVRKSGRRLYDDHALPRTALIRTLKAAGFALDEIRQLLADDSASRHARRSLVEARLKSGGPRRLLLGHRCRVVPASASGYHAPALRFGSCAPVRTSPAPAIETIRPAVFETGAAALDRFHERPLDCRHVGGQHDMPADGQQRLPVHGHLSTLCVRHATCSVTRPALYRILSG